jgi:hypothetical protein
MTDYIPQDIELKTHPPSSIDDFVLTKLETTLKILPTVSSVFLSLRGTNIEITMMTECISVLVQQLFTCTQTS